MPEVLDQLFAAVQHSLPQRGLTATARRFARIRNPLLKNTLIRAFAESCGVDWSEAEHARPEDYPDFNAFFTRALKPGARPLPQDPHALIAPCDGAISQMGNIDDDRLFQAKGMHYTLPALLGGEDHWSQTYWNGSFATIYLSPRDYHRVHMPLNGRLVSTRHIPGRLFSVNSSSARTIPNLFVRNERLVCRFKSDIGEFTLILVGAMMVAGIETVWDGPIKWRRDGDIEETHYLNNGQGNNNAPDFLRGEEIGRFNYGSTVILLFPTHPFSQQKTTGAQVKMGMPL